MNPTERAIIAIRYLHYLHSVDTIDSVEAAQLLKKITDRQRAVVFHHLSKLDY